MRIVFAQRKKKIVFHIFTTTRLHHVLSRTHVHKRYRRNENVECNRNFLSLLKNIYCGFVKLLLNPWCYMDYFTNLLVMFLDMGTFQDMCLVLLSMESLRALKFKQKHLNLCSDDERRSYGFGTTSRWVITDIIFIFLLTNPLTNFSSFY